MSVNEELEIPDRPRSPNRYNPFFDAFELVVESEGGFVNHPDDPGKATKYGVSLRAVQLRDVDRDGKLDFDLDHDGDVDEWDIRLVTIADAQRLYREDYWSLKGASNGMLNCESLPYVWSIATFDCAVLQGPRTAVALVQRAVGAKDDGILGPATVARVKAVNTVEGLALFSALRLERMRHHPKADTFFKGWAKRLAVLNLRLGRSIMREV